MSHRSAPLFSPAIRRIWRAALCIKPSAFFPLRLFDWHSLCVIRSERTRCSKLNRNALFANRRFPYFGSIKPDFDNSKTVDARQLVNKGLNIGNAGDRNEALVLPLPDTNCPGGWGPARRSVRNARQRTPHRA
ncbi:hypothetical protein [Paraburkholderia caribensis]|uniref:hypothetical protein n=1 Tax=Paraburkholderia caribensis TaxID=75105 RepID=UPI000BF00CCF|nr:hypothetical protein [Paraburkholderia caribensis]